VLRVGLIGSNRDASVSGAGELPGKINYFIGDNSKKWRTNIPTFAKVRYKNVYPGIDLVYYGNQGGQLEYDFVVAPGANPDAIALAVNSAGDPSAARPDTRAQITDDGDLVIPATSGEMRLHKPIVYQPAGSASHRIVDGRFTLDAQNRVRFALGPYDHTQPLVIDPVLIFSTFFGGNGTDGANTGIVVDASGNIYIAGGTTSTNFPTAGPFQSSLGGTQSGFISKLNWDGSALSLVYSTYLGGNDSSGAQAGDYCEGLAVDSAGDAYVTGLTSSDNFPTLNATQPTFPAGSDPRAFNAFVTELNPLGSGLIFSTYLGGSTHGAVAGAGEEGDGIAIGPSGDIYVVGETNTTDFPILNPVQATLNSTNYNGFVTRFHWSGSALSLVYSTYLGGSAPFDMAYAVAVDSSGDAYVTGVTGSTNFPIANAFQPTFAGMGEIPSNAFVTRLHWSGSALSFVYSTYLGGSVEDQGNAIAVDSSGNAYVAGFTASPNFRERYVKRSC
jgi:hypothetical protein